MRYKVVQLALIAWLSVFVTGCNDFLDQSPDDRTEINSVEKVQKLLVTAYPSSTFAGIIEFRCDGYIDKGSPINSLGGTIDFTTTSFRWDKYDLSSNADDSNESYWAACYNAIGVANHALGALKKMDYPAGSEHARSEAYIARAYAHFCLVSLYANMFERGAEGTNPGIPYVIEPEEVIHKDYDRETVEITLNKVWEDFERGMRGLKGADEYVKYGLEPKFHFSPTSAYAFATRYNLFTEDYASVISYANRLIGQPGKEVVLDLTGTPALNADGTQQVIVPVKDPVYIDMGNRLLDRESLRGFKAAAGLGHSATDPTRECNLIVSQVKSTMSLANAGRAYNRYTLSTIANNSVFGSNVTGGSWNYKVFGVSGDPQGFAAKSWYDFKYYNVVAGIGTFYTRLALFRMDEVLLNRAEAYVMLGDYNSALLDLNMYTQKKINKFDYATHLLSRDKVVEYYESKVASKEHYLNSNLNGFKFSSAKETYEGKLQRALILTILDFRRSEFIYEGMRYFDILRWNIPVVHTLFSGEVDNLNPDDARRVLQLPESTSLSGLEPNIWSTTPVSEQHFVIIKE